MKPKVLGLITILCAPAMLAEDLIGKSNLVMGIASMIFMLGSFSSLWGLWQLKATGTSKWGRGVLIWQMFLVVLAFLFGVFEASQIISSENILYIITDIAWPLSMLSMLFVAITTAVVGVLPGWRRFAILPSGLIMVISILASIVIGSSLSEPVIAFASVVAMVLCWCLMGFTVFSSDPSDGVQRPIQQPA
jgi:hypothetical protein